MTSAQNYILADGTVDYANLLTMPPRVTSHNRKKPARTDSDLRELQRISHTYLWRLRKNPDLLPILWQDAKNGNSHARLFLSSAAATFILLDLAKFNSLQKPIKFLTTPFAQAIMYEAMATFMDKTGKGYDNRRIGLLDFRLLAKKRTHTVVAKTLGANMNHFYGLLKLKRLHYYHRLTRNDQRGLTAEIIAKFLRFRTRNRTAKAPLKSSYQNMADAVNYFNKTGSLPSVEAQAGLRYGPTQMEVPSPLDEMIAAEQKDEMVAVVDYGMDNHTREMRILLSTYAGNSCKEAGTETGMSREHARKLQLKMLKDLRQWRIDPEIMRDILDYAGKAWQRRQQKLKILDQARKSREESLQKRRTTIAAHQATATLQQGRLR